jgi:predicted nuclease of predicted toxin-antitoxin system
MICAQPSLTPRVCAASKASSQWPHDVHRGRPIAAPLGAGVGRSWARCRAPLDFPAGNRTPDSDIVAGAIRESRVVATKDNDFVTSFLLRGVPPKLLLSSTGNISNDALSKLLAANLAALEAALTKYDFVELSTSTLTIHA